uniref:Mucosa-associated lymphoid tissue lymphoma translocation protein 1-like n=1 Tax=Paramormyrops kingsleyae TaxID=1676925 RepID=A0A3B3S6C8_9TELE|nr:mucosa-associated lymphoid tissue lymphoma translocation protein 1-like [Paramormyrops kingsleyae]XP_023666981.1 mucosa-associated lymphoid tissue lymphoma translocation protein 1-like [Paramormyrops kingsleyae]
MVQCLSFHSKVLKIMINEIVIVQQPLSVCVPYNYTVTLSVRAVGLDPLQYQWFQSEEEVVPGGTRSDLVISAHRKQYFVCRINDQQNNFVFSNWVKVKVLKAEVSPGLHASWRGEPHIALQPESQRVQRRGRITLQCWAFGIPAPQLQWYHNGLLMPGATAETLEIENADEEHAGSYLCCASNVLGEKWTESAEIVLPENITLKRLAATDKVALLIGNLNYQHHPVLMAPVVDVHELSNLLRGLGFRVVSLLDLTKAEMLASIEKFLQLLDRGVYALFYYAGHGYECSGRNYLVPIDAPQPYRPENCISVQRVMRRMQEKHTALNVVLLDTCRKWYNQHCVPSEIKSLDPLGNTVYGFATCEGAEAFEVQDGSRSTGVFTKYLNMNILRPEKITRVLERVSEDLGRDPLVTGKQVMEIRHTLKDPRSLADPISAAGHTGELLLRDLCWKQANDLPAQRLVSFPCGAVVELSFSALFSNVLVVFATVKDTGSQAQDCSVALRSSPALEDIFSIAGWSDEMNTLLLTNTDAPDCCLRFCGLQKLQKPLMLTVELHYSRVRQHQRLTESRQQNIGRPLVARCELYKRTVAEGAAAAAAVGTVHTDYRPRPRPPSSQPCRPSTRKAENAVTRPAQSSSPRDNEPEENDESEPLGWAL